MRERRTHCTRCRVRLEQPTPWQTCARCRAYRTKRYREVLAEGTARVEYTPIDELLERPSVQILRQLRHHDWATFGDLAVALDIANRAAVQRYAKALARLVDGELVDCDRRRLGSYRITPAGRAHLARLLTVDLEACASDAELLEGDEAAA